MPNESPEKLDHRSMDITEEKKQQLKQLFPEVFREDTIDFDHLKRVLGEWVDPGKERFGLNWPGKAECMKTIQQPSVATLRPDREESVNFDETDHLFIEGDNLEVLKLLQKSYFDKVKMIYIDPPYNTGNEFIYPDDYKESLDTYLQYTGQKDAEGNWQTTNKETEGRFHSNWLNMMYPRLFLAKNLLREDGAIFISIDDGEVANLRKLCDEVYGEENFVANFIWKSRQIVDSRNKTKVSVDHEYILVYSKNFDKFSFLGKDIDTSKYSNQDNDPRGPWMSNSILGLASASQRPNLHYTLVNPDTGDEFECPPDSGWRYSEETMAKKIEEERILFPSKPDGRPREKKYIRELSSRYTGFSSILNEEAGYTLNGSREVRDLLGKKYFDFPKPTTLLEILIDQGLKEDKDGIVLDFFSGSSSTAHSVLNLNKADGGERKFLMVQLPEPTDEDSEASHAGFKNISDISKERIRRVIQQIKEEQNQDKQLELGDDGEQLKEQDLGFKVFKLTPSNFKVWEAPGVDIDPEKLKEQLDAFADHLNAETEEESILYELVLKSGFSLTANIEKLELSGAAVYNIEDKKLMICLENQLTFELLDAIAEEEPKRFICLDNSFTGKDADALKTNAVQLFKSKGIIFKTV
jgi:adenine-specific DNA-methyltransferase